MKMICFPHAGGISNYYSFLKDDVLKGIDEVIVYEYPKRGLKLQEDEYVSFEAAVDRIADELIEKGYCDEAYVLFGHSMGAFIAYELGKCLRTRIGRTAELIIVSGQKPPCVVDPDHYRQCEQDGIEYLKKLGGVPDIIMQHPDVMKYFWKLCEQDFRLLQTYHPDKSNQDVKIPKGVVICGENDVEVDAKELPLWSVHIENILEIYLCEGDHFYFSEEHNGLINFINKWL